MPLAREITVCEAGANQYLLEWRNLECTCHSETFGKSEAGHRGGKENHRH